MAHGQCPQSRHFAGNGKGQLAWPHRHGNQEATPRWMHSRARKSELETDTTFRSKSMSKTRGFPQTNAAGSIAIKSNRRPMETATGRAKGSLPFLPRPSRAAPPDLAPCMRVDDEMDSSEQSRQDQRRLAEQCSVPRHATLPFSYSLQVGGATEVGRGDERVVRSPRFRGWLLRGRGRGRGRRNHCEIGSIAAWPVPAAPCRASAVVAGRATGCLAPAGPDPRRDGVAALRPEERTGRYVRFSQIRRGDAVDGHKTQQSEGKHSKE